MEFYVTCDSKYRQVVYNKSELRKTDLSIGLQNVSRRTSIVSYLALIS